MDLKITEKSAVAQKQFMEKAGKLVAKMTKPEQLTELLELCASEYMKLFGRFGTNPLLSVKGGKPKPRYLIDRDEVWVIYKPPLWQMGGIPRSWTAKVQRLAAETKGLAEAQKKMVDEPRASNLQEFHGLTHGLRWIQGEDITDPCKKSVKDWGFIQRLDLETDGPVITAKTYRAQRILQVQLKEHIFSKAYICLVHGKLENRIHSVRGKFAEMGGFGQTQIMLKHDVASDPFYQVSQRGWYKQREIRDAKTLLKPMAYYKKKDDDSEYTLVYVNILSGITHQVRITMQSLGHPLVSDDRYLPREQAIADCQWCPRNFLCEVRSDWFDLCGPFKYPNRRRFARISAENPLPQLFQDILEKKLVLIQKLDPNCDLYQGCSYWALGDEQLMADHPKDSVYRKKVMRWGIRRGIHLDALDRLLLLSREEIDQIMAEYQPPEVDTAFWVCPLCMSLNHPTRNSDGTSCKGHIKQTCSGKLRMPSDTKLPDGWRNYLADPTYHLITKMNPLLLEARRTAIEKPRPSWDRPPSEEEGDNATPSQIKSLHDALVEDAKKGGYGLDQEYLPQVPGLEDAKLPLCVPPDCEVRRVRLPGRGLGSQWRYTLTGKERLKVTANFSVKLKKYSEPLLVDTDVLPPKQLLDDGEPRNEQPASWNAPDQMEVDAWAGSSKEPTNQRRSKPVLKEPEDITRKRPMESAPEPSPRKRAKRDWRKVESQSKPGLHYYVDAETGEFRYNMPPDFKEEAVWEEIESKTQKGKFFYHNRDTGETRVEKPLGVTTFLKPEKSREEEGIGWQRLESKSKPGHYYYFNPETGENEIRPPKVQAPWKLLESKTKPGQWYYYNEDTAESTEIPPPCAVPAARFVAQREQAEQATSAPQASPARAAPRANPSTAVAADELPEGWEKHMSSTHQKFYYINTKTHETTWTPPPREKPADQWERRESSKYPGKFYLQNLSTGRASQVQVFAHIFARILKHTGHVSMCERLELESC